ncbi:hypothetical protein DPMN_140276 [Dreissena polymorpha]|uniref:Ig-like domain-containing protein n=1 Tax=Dreissena polymorpha TaxID=45954 RepID=A0A9D4GB86_DREPO|nr:hypothetical protein DPMN_140276 [Dreissena polymorpha]
MYLMEQHIVSVERSSLKVEGYKTSPKLTVDEHEVSVNSSITLKCSTSETPFAVAWFNTEKDHINENLVIAQQWLEDEKQCRSDNSAMECFCSSSQVY